MGEKNLPFWGFIKGLIWTAASWFWVIVQPDKELWWLWAITFPLTLVWMYQAKPETKKLFNDAAGVVIFGLLALALVLSLLSGILDLIRWVWGQPWYFKIPLILIGIFVIGKVARIPGVSYISTKIYGGCKWLVMKVWSLHKHAKEHPNNLYMVFGALCIAGFINGQPVTRLTDTESLVPGILPGISAVVGLVCLILQIRRYARGERQLPVAPAPQVPPAEPVEDGWECRARVIKRDARGKKIPQRDAQGELIRRNGRLLPQTVPCGKRNAPDAERCESCNAPKPGVPHGDPPPPPPDPEPETESAIVCRSCGRNLNPRTATRNCPYCGTRFGQPVPEPAPTATTPHPVIRLVDDSLESSDDEWFSNL